MSADEEWRPVVGWEGLYEVSSLGRVRSLGRVVIKQHASAKREVAFKYRGRVLTAHQIRGYPTVMLADRSRRETARVHRLVCLAFHGPGKDGLEVAHADGVRSNARASNLRWATRRENAHDTFAHGTNAAGDRHPQRKLSSADVIAIRASSHRGIDLAQRYGVSPQNICAIRKRHTWKEVP